MTVRFKRDGRGWLRGMQNRLKDATPVGRDIATAMRFGPGGIAEQFTQRAEFPLAGGRRPWWRARRDWSRPGERRGQYRDAWLGRHAAARQTSFRRGATVGVNPRAQPRMWRVNMLQNRTPTRIDMRRRKNKRKMQLKLGLLYGVFASVVTIHPRPMSVNPRMLSSVGDVVTRYVARGRR